MKRVRFVAFVLFFPLFLAPLSLSAELGFQLDYASKYIWRGFDLNPPGKPVLQPSLDLSIGDGAVFFNVWGSFSFENKELNEVDITAGFNFEPAPFLLLQMGVIHYGWYFERPFDFSAHTSHELFISLEVTGLLIDPQIDFFYDFHNGEGIYLSAGISPALDIFEYLVVGLDASIGYNAGMWLEDNMDPGFSDANLGLSLKIDLGRFSVRPFLNYTFVLLDGISREDHFYFGVSVACRPFDR